MDDALLWYFAYGSNLEPRTFLGRRGMRPLASRRVRLAGYRLVFDLPVGPGERGVANLRADAEAEVHGVVWQLRSAQADFLDRTEGVPQGAYRRRTVRPVDDAGAALEAFTYESPRSTDGRKPSARYLGLLLAGARHHDLPAAWIETLRAFPLAHDERLPPQGELFSR